MTKPNFSHFETATLEATVWAAAYAAWVRREPSEHPGLNHQIAVECANDAVESFFDCINEPTITDVRLAAEEYEQKLNADAAKPEES